MSIINKFFFIACLLPSMVIAGDLSSQQAEKFFLRHIEASGGENALMRMESISRYGLIAFYAQGNLNGSYCYHTDIIYPKKLREQIKGKQIEYDRGTDGISFWLWTGSHYEHSEDKDLIGYMRDTAERANRDLLWVEKETSNFEEIHTPPSWAPNNSQCVRAKNITRRTYCFDDSTGLLNALGSPKEYRLESDWREVGNIKIPFHLTHYLNGVMVYEIQLDYAKLNEYISNEQFIKPSIPQSSC